jgi:hypothetical protein
LVQVHVGRPPAVFRFQTRRLLVSFSILPPRGVPFAGICLWKRRGPDPFREMLILLAGPLASALCAVAFGLAALLAYAHHGTWIAMNVAGAGALLGLISFLYNVDPRPATASERAGQLRRDGPRALHCFRVWRAVRRGEMVLPAPEPAEPPRPASVPPPGRRVA